MDLTEINQAARKAAAMLGESGQVGREEITPGFSLTFDGDFTGKTLFKFDDENGLVKVSDYVLTADEARSLKTAGIDDGKQTQSMDISLYCDMDEEALAEGALLLETRNEGYIWCVSANEEIAATMNLDGGTWFGVSFQNGVPYYWVSAIKGEDTTTIHPIDEKFLPGVCLPVGVDCLALHGLLGENTQAEVSPGDIQYIVDAVRNNAPLYFLVSVADGDAITTARIYPAALTHYTNGTMEQAIIVFPLAIGEDGTASQESWTFFLNKSNGYALVTKEVKTPTSATEV